MAEDEKKRDDEHVDERAAHGDGDGDGDGDGLQQRWASLALVGLNAAVFLATLLAGESALYAVGAVMAAGVEPSHVWAGEIWRFATACFVHLGIWHLALNAWVLWQLGPVLERFVGGSRVLLIYISSGVFGFALSTALRGVPSAGASGAVFGVTGALIAVALLLKRDERAAQGELGRLLLGALVPFVVATFVLGFLVPNAVDNTAHLGGLLFGVILGYGLSVGDARLFSPGSAGAQAKWRGIASLLTSAVLFVVVTMYGARPVMSPHYHAVSGLAALRNGPAGRGIAAAKEHAQQAARLGPDDASTFVLLGRIKQDAALATPAGGTSEDEKEGARLVREGLRRADVDEPAEDWALIALMHLVNKLSLAGGTEELPFTDVRTVDALCDAALLEHEARAPKSPAGELKNTCAWLWLKAPDPTVRDAPRALELARAAVAETNGENASIVHTLAEALAQNGEAREGLAHLEKIATMGKAGELPGGKDFLDAERRRLKRLAESKAPGEPAPSSAPTGAQEGASP